MNRVGTGNKQTELFGNIVKITNTVVDVIMFKSHITLQWGGGGIFLALQTQYTVTYLHN